MSVQLIHPDTKQPIAVEQLKTSELLAVLTIEGAMDAMMPPEVANMTRADEQAAALDVYQRACNEIDRRIPIPKETP